MKIKFKKIVYIAVIGAFIASLAACNTIKGVGKDTEKVGETIQKEAEKRD